VQSNAAVEVYKVGCLSLSIISVFQGDFPHKRGLTVYIDLSEGDMVIYFYPLQQTCNAKEIVLCPNSTEEFVRYNSV
jgi:hypothetical protein